MLPLPSNLWLVIIHRFGTYTRGSWRLAPASGGTLEKLTLADPLNLSYDIDCLPSRC